jgi:hypothetical protein
MFSSTCPAANPGSLREGSNELAAQWLLGLNLNVHVCALGDGIEHRRILRQSLQTFQIVDSGLRPEVDTNICKTLWYIAGQSEKSA